MRIELNAGLAVKTEEPLCSESVLTTPDATTHPRRETQFRTVSANQRSLGIRQNYGATYEPIIRRYGETDLG